MKREIFLSAPFILLLLAAGAAPQNRPPVPFVDRGACPFECCTYRQWTVDKPTIVHSAMTDTSAVAFRLRAGEKVRGMTGVVITTVPGVAEVLKPVVEGRVRLSRGDRVFLLTNLGEGFAKAWFKGRIFQAEVLDDEQYKIVSDTKSVWWVKVRNSKGQVGWSRQPEHFGNMDQCG